MQLHYAEIDAILTSLLRSQPPGTMALLADFLGAYWDGTRVVYFFLHEDGSGAPDDEFELSDYLVDKWEEELRHWFAAPRFSMRPELNKWIKSDA
ncbi:hypothetical protein AWB64_02138 [Caballeronia sordidicola]|uniref:Uncharacterized protein n=1 Tax=Caballeronia sordidicola TaxID=196367 RepID=A0A158G1X0_CABSO|nr:hypothetical protein [Caballeronia sordidicola]SAL26128.1 hypothetical protein AWB64_02138 [Caballeronia sordidicola]